MYWIRHRSSSLHCVCCFVQLCLLKTTRTPNSIALVLILRHVCFLREYYMILSFFSIYSKPIEVYRIKSNSVYIPACRFTGKKCNLYPLPSILDSKQFSTHLYCTHLTKDLFTYLDIETSLTFALFSLKIRFFVLVPTVHSPFVLWISWNLQNTISAVWKIDGNSSTKSHQLRRGSYYWIFMLSERSCCEDSLPLLFSILTLADFNWLFSSKNSRVSLTTSWKPCFCFVLLSSTVALPKPTFPELCNGH